MNRRKLVGKSHFVPGVSSKFEEDYKDIFYIYNKSYIFLKNIDFYNIKWYNYIVRIKSFKGYYLL